MLRQIELKKGYKYGLFDILTGSDGLQQIATDTFNAIAEGMANGLGSKGLILSGLEKISGGVIKQFNVSPGIGITNSGTIIRITDENKPVNKPWADTDRYAWIEVAVVDDTSKTAESFVGNMTTPLVKKHVYTLKSSRDFDSDATDILLIDAPVSDPKNNLFLATSELKGTAEGIVAINSSKDSIRITATNPSVLVKDSTGYKFLELGEGQVAVCRGEEVIAENLPESLDLIGVTEAVLYELPKSYEKIFEKTYNDPNWNDGVNSGDWNTVELEIAGARIGDAVIVTSLSSVLGMALNMTAYVSSSGTVTFGWKCISSAVEPVIRDSQVRITVISAGV